MRKMISSTFGALVLAVAWPALAQEPRDGDLAALDANAGNDALQLRYLTSAPVLADIKSDLDYGLLLSDERDLVGSAAWLFDTHLNLVPGLRLNIGPEAYLAKLANQNTGAFAVAVAGEARYELIRRLGISAFGSAAYAPHVLMFGTPTNVTDFTAGAQVRFAPRLYAQAGYRWFTFKFPGAPDDRIQNGVFVGLRWDVNH